MNADRFFEVRPYDDQTNSPGVGTEPDYYRDYRGVAHFWQGGMWNRSVVQPWRACLDDILAGGGYVREVNPDEGPWA